MNEPMITDRQPDSGNPTVRGERGLAETWAMVWAKRARNAETLKQPSLGLMLRAPYFYPTSFHRVALSAGPARLTSPELCALCIGRPVMAMA